MAEIDVLSSPVRSEYSESSYMPSSSPLAASSAQGMSSPLGTSSDNDMQTPRARRPKGTRRRRTIRQKVYRVLRALASCNMSLVQFLDALFYGNKACISDPVMVQTRRGFAQSAQLPALLTHILKPPHRTAKRHGRSFKGAKGVLTTFAFDTVRDRLSTEVKRYERHVASEAARPLDGDSLLAISLDEIFKDMETQCPSLSGLLSDLMTGRNASRRKSQRYILHRRNVISVIGSIIVFSRSQRQNQLQRKLSIYMKAKGTPTKVFDFLQSIGLTMSYRWTLATIDNLADAASADMRAWVATKAAIVNMDNVLLVYPVQSQRVDNRTATINATACTVVKVPSHCLATLNSYGAELLALRTRLAHLRVTDPSAMPRLAFVDLVDAAADVRLAKLHIHYILLVLRDAPGLADFKHRDHSIFDAPAAVRQLPTGPDHRTEYFMLQTEPIDEISYEGSKRCISAFLKQMGLDDAVARTRYGTQSALPWGGDGLTTARMRALQRYCVDARNGWDRLDWLIQYSCVFHKQWWVGIDIHHNHYGTALGNGLGREIQFLGRTGMAANKKKPDFHTLDEMIAQFWTASTLDCWLWCSGCSSLADLRAWADSRTPAELLTFGEKIYFERQSTAALGDLEEQQRLQGTLDDVLHARILADRDMAFYLILRRSLKKGDIGVYIDAMPRLLAFYKGSGNTHYARELYETMQFLFKEASPAMRDFVFEHCLLVNLSGQPDRFMPTGQLQEHNNDKIKNNHSTHASSSSMDLVKRISPALPVMDAICKDVDAHFTHLYCGTNHSSPNADRDITRMVARFSEARVHHLMPGRTSASTRDKPVDVIRKGLLELQSGEYLNDCWESRELFLRYASTAQDYSAPPSEEESQAGGGQASSAAAAVESMDMDDDLEGVSWSDIEACDADMVIDM